MKHKRILALVGIALLLAVPLAGLHPAAVQADALAARQQQIKPAQIIKSVVQIWAVDDSSDGWETKWWGSGTIISKDGLILTNCHVANPYAMYGDPDDQYDALLVALTVRSDQPSVPTYIAELAQYDPDLDLAVIRIVETMDGSPVDESELKSLPALSIADSDVLEIGDKLHIYGYPVTGGDTISYVEGTVSGFTSERGIDGRAWIKTDASIAGGNSGGTAVNDDGALVAVPTQMGSGSEDAPYADCRYIQDTNGDGEINEEDTCVYTGFFNALRPVNLAAPLIEAASRGLGPQPKPTPEPEKPTGRATATRLFFSDGVNEYDQPTHIVDTLPEGATAVYLFFDYKNFQDGVGWQPTLIYENEVYTDVWPIYEWSGGAEGNWWISLNNDPLPDGAYKFTVNYDGQPLGSANLTVGGAESKNPSFSNMVISGGGSEGFMLPADVTEVEAAFDYENMKSTTRWSYAWYYEGEQVAGDDGTSFSKASGSSSVSLSGQFDPGNYRVELFINDTLAGSADFIVGGGDGDGGGDITSPFLPIVFSESVDRNDNPVNPHDADEPFESGSEELYAFFDYEGMQDGWSWGRRWSLDGEVITDAEDTWEGGESGNWWVSINNGGDSLPDGEYTLELLVEGQVVQTGVTEIGGGPGPKPTPTPKPGEGVEIYGQITDADTGRGVAGAVFVVLQPGMSLADFTGSEDEIYTYAEADDEGNYELNDPLMRGEEYTIIVGAEDYNPIVEEGVAIPDDLESPYELNLELQAVQ